MVRMRPDQDPVATLSDPPWPWEYEVPDIDPREYKALVNRKRKEIPASALKRYTELTIEMHLAVEAMLDFWGSWSTFSEEVETVRRLYRMRLTALLDKRQGRDGTQQVADAFMAALAKVAEDLGEEP
jgi:hypothetical protein